MGPPQRFHELLNMKVLLQILEIRWSWHFKYWNSAVLSKPTIIKWIANSELLQCSGVHCTKIILNVHTVCDVIIACRCGTLPPFAAIILLLALDCMMELWISLSESCHVLFLYIRIHRKLCSDTTIFFVLQSQLTKLSAIHRRKLNQPCGF